MNKYGNKYVPLQVCLCVSVFVHALLFKCPIFFSCVEKWTIKTPKQCKDNCNHMPRNTFEYDQAFAIKLYTQMNIWIEMLQLKAKFRRRDSTILLSSTLFERKDSISFLICEDVRQILDSQYVFFNMFNFGISIDSLKRFVLIHLTLFIKADKL